MLSGSAFWVLLADNRGLSSLSSSLFSAILGVYAETDLQTPRIVASLYYVFFRIRSAPRGTRRARKNLRV